MLVEVLNAYNCSVVDIPTAGTRDNIKYGRRKHRVPNHTRLILGSPLKSVKIVEVKMSNISCACCRIVDTLLSIK